MTNAQQRRLGRALKTAFIPGVITFFSGIIIALTDIGSQNPWLDYVCITLVYLPPIVLFIGCLSLAILTSSLRVRMLAIAAMLLLPFGPMCLFFPPVRSGLLKALGWSPTSGCLASLIGAWVCGIVAAGRAASGNPYPGYPACQKCGYNLTGNVSGVCPECGQLIGTN